MARTITADDVGEVVDDRKVRLVKLGGDITRIIPGHDPDVLVRYPSLSEDLTGVVAVLHEKPSY